ncbi:MAG: flagellar hook capping FlgD N-terminal domain-containing protein [Bordetella sp.]
MAINSSIWQAPSSIPTMEGYKAQQKEAKVGEDQMGEREFLLLFTTQLQNQNPLDPMDNEAFVAQLAQFSQLEATTSMSENINSLVSSMKGERMLQGASLLGKKVAVPEGPAILENGAPISGIVSVPNGAEGVELAIYDRSGAVVKSELLGRQAPGDVLVRWDGTNARGEQMPDGVYQMVATVRSFGEVTKIPISTPDVVKSVSYSAEADDLVLEVASGATVTYGQVKQINN